MRNFHRWSMVTLLAMSVTVAALGQQKEAVKKDEATTRLPVSFSKDVVPIIAKNCLPCHAADQSNPSELSLDSYDLLMKGGKHGEAVKPGKASESVLLQKLLPDPPFGDRMPFDPRKKRRHEPMKPLTDEEISIITEWVNQGAKNN